MKNPFKSLRNVFVGFGLAQGERKETVRLVWRIPPHIKREDDPNYAIFDRRRRELKRKGLLVCPVHNCPAPNKQVELHHKIPYALSTGIDVKKLSDYLGFHNAFPPEMFQEWLHSSQVIPLCDYHHRLVHSIPGPAWDALQVWRSDLPPPIRLAGVDER